MKTCKTMQISFLLAQVIVVNFNYEFKAYDPQTCVKVRKYPPVNIRRITFHPYTVLSLDPNKVKINYSVVGFSSNHI